MYQQLVVFIYGITIALSCQIQDDISLYYNSDINIYCTHMMAAVPLLQELHLLAEQPDSSAARGRTGCTEL